MNLKNRTEETLKHSEIIDDVAFGRIGVENNPQAHCCLKKHTA